ncbi:wall-associated kinase family protein [Salix suchowensis]|nr:wall-associated kinase family protein [Salix suchowensis]
MVWKLVFQSMLMLLMFQLAAAAQPIAKPGCRDRCGDISIPYPFGIGKDCYMNESFAIECNETGAFIIRIEMEVLNISAERSAATVKGPIISSNCTGTKNGVPLNLNGTPFVFSSHNVFVAVGCNTQALMSGTRQDLVGCVSPCSDVESKNFCRASPPSFLQVFNPKLEATDDNQDREGCKLAFLVNQTWFESNISDPLTVQYRDYVPAELGWMMNRNIDDQSVICRGYQNRSFGSECVCHGGYEGIPYRELGCKDVDECKESKHSCRGLLKCVNTPGSFNCEINKLYIALIVIGAVVLALSLLMGIWWLYKLVKKWKNIELKKKFFKRNGGLLLQQELSAADGRVHNIYSSKELGVATDRFNVNRILGQGGQGTVYKGMLADGRIVAVKKSTVVDEGKLEEFINEVFVLSQINHRNVVKLIGCCLETEVPLLVYEFIPNGNLYNYIHDQNQDFLLSWDMRLRIAFEVAGALSYLHSAASIPIYHRDIKSTNILLDEKYRAKISDFGSSRSISIEQTHLTTVVQGTFGYLDPEYFQSSQFTEKSDVYSFGVVLVELISGQKPIFSVSQTETRSLATHFIMLMEDNRLSDILDARVKELCQNEEAILVANLANRCLNFNGKNRPTMREVASELERIIGLSQKELSIQENCKISKNIMDGASNDWDASKNIMDDAVSTLITGDFDTSRNPSSDGEQPLINTTKC